MNPYIITPDQCYFENDDLKHFLCGVCGNLVQRFLFHDGGFGQDYCQRPYCCSCIDSCGKTPVRPGGKRDYAPVKCPVENCEATFQQPKFRNPSLCDIELYSMIQVTCKKCGVIFSNPEVYGKHLPRCCGSFQSKKLPGAVANCSLSKLNFLESLRRQSYKQCLREFTENPQQPGPENFLRESAFSNEGVSGCRGGPEVRFYKAPQLGNL
uniref:Uncharacterized protein n=1 Tax=Tetranychus urticae TaxID=32264 RepID=T1KG86_TETUR